MAARRRRVHGSRGSTPTDGAPTSARAFPDREAPPRELQDLLSDIRELRLTLAADLAAAAGAVEAGAEDVAGEILTADGRELGGFVRRSRTRLRTLDADGPLVICAPVAGSDAPMAANGARWGRRALVALPAVPLVGALAVSAAAATGLLPGLPHAPRPAQVRAVATPTAPTAAVASTFHQFEDVLEHDPSASQVVAAASALHRQLEQMIASSSHDPAHVTEVAKLLQLEQALLIRTRPPGTATVLAASRKLEQRLVVVVVSSQPTSRQTPTGMHPSHPSRHPSSPQPTPTPASTTAPAPAPSPTSTPSSASTPSSSPTPTSSSSNAPHLPSIGS